MSLEALALLRSKPSRAQVGADVGISLGAVALIAAPLVAVVGGTGYFLYKKNYVGAAIVGGGALAIAAATGFLGEVTDTLGMTSSSVPIVPVATPAPPTK